jgi:hemerythrin
MTYPLPLLGIPAIDDQHRNLLHNLERLELWMEKGHGFAAALDAFTALNDYVAQHFRDEESIYRAAGYPKLEEHIRIHRQICSDLTHLYQLALDGGDITDDLLVLVRDWLVTHIGVEDMEFALYTGSRQPAVR